MNVERTIKNLILMVTIVIGERGTMWTIWPSAISVCSVAHVLIMQLSINGIVNYYDNLTLSLSVSVCAFTTQHTDAESMRQTKGTQICTRWWWSNDFVWARQDQHLMVFFFLLYCVVVVWLDKNNIAHRWWWSLIHQSPRALFMSSILPSSYIAWRVKYTKVCTCVGALAQSTSRWPTAHEPTTNTKLQHSQRKSPL